jgi:L-arabinose isomerase
MTTQVGVDVFRDFATMSGTELLVIDGDTTLSAFERELRWNAAYYRLARGL